MHRFINTYPSVHRYRPRPSCSRNDAATDHAYVDPKCVIIDFWNKESYSINYNTGFKFGYQYIGLVCKLIHCLKLLQPATIWQAVLTLIRLFMIFYDIMKYLISWKVFTISWQIIFILWYHEIFSWYHEKNFGRTYH